MLQVFESSCDHISREQFLEVCLPYLRQIPEKLRARLSAQDIPHVPMTIFAKGGGHSLAEQAQLGYEVVGVDYNTDATEARLAVGPNITLQGNLDPQDLYKTQVSHQLL